MTSLLDHAAGASPLTATATATASTTVAHDVVCEGTRVARAAAARYPLERRRRDDVAFLAGRAVDGVIGSLEWRQCGAWGELQELSRVAPTHDALAAATCWFEGAIGERLNPLAQRLDAEARWWWGRGDGTSRAVAWRVAWVADSVEAWGCLAAEEYLEREREEEVVGSDG